MTQVEIRPLLSGTGLRPKSKLISGAKPDDVDVHFIMFYIHAPGHHILVDTGVTPADGALPQHIPCRSLPQQHPREQLKGIGVDPDDIDIVVNTHLHWDHCANNDAFPNAAVYAQRDELRYAAAPLPLHRHAYDEIEYGATHDCPTLPPYLRRKLTLIDGDLQLCPEVTILTTPGHTPGSQSVLVQGTRRYLLAGDNVPLYESLPQSDRSDFLPNPLYVDLASYYKSLSRSQRTADVIIPSHDGRVLDQTRFI